MSLTDQLKWRYAVKKYSDRKVDQSKIDAITDAINLSATSTGIQPYRLIVVSDPELKQKLGEGSFNPQIREASHLIVFAATEHLSHQQIDDYMKLVAETRGVPVESLAEFKGKLAYYFFEVFKPEDHYTWASRQAYIGLGTALLAAAEQEVDSTPMEGFDAARFDEMLGLKEKGLKSAVVLALGYRDEENDVFASLKKVRLPKQEFVMER